MERLRFLVANLTLLMWKIYWAVFTQSTIHLVPEEEPGFKFCHLGCLAVLQQQD